MTRRFGVNVSTATSFDDVVAATAGVCTITDDVVASSGDAIVTAAGDGSMSSPTQMTSSSGVATTSKAAVISGILFDR